MIPFITLAENLLSVPFTAATDFTDLADCCDRFAETLMECNEPAYKLALLGRIGACLALLRPTLSEPIPAHLIERFTVDALPGTPSYFEPDAEALCEYCQTLTKVLCQQSLLPEMEKSLRGLLCELMWMFAGELNAPRWARQHTEH
ncbi:hypothetical protein D3C81_134920 [compost metagenome]